MKPRLGVGAIVRLKKPRGGCSIFLIRASYLMVSGTGLTRLKYTVSVRNRRVKSGVVRYAIEADDISEIISTSTGPRV